MTIQWRRLTWDLFPCLVLTGLVFLAPSMACASAWPQLSGHTEIIASLEPGNAVKAYDATGSATTPLTKWNQTDALIYIDHGMTSRLSLTGKINLKAYEAEGTHFSGLSSVELGARYALHTGQDFVLAAGANLEGLGSGRRNDFDTVFGRQGTDADLRVYFGKDLRIARIDAFIDLQVARHLRQYNPDQWRIDATLGLKPSPKWMVLAQAFAGRADRQASLETEWVNAEISLVRNFGSRHQNSLQMGLRRTVAGRNVPMVTALTLSLWRRY